MKNPLRHPRAPMIFLAYVCAIVVITVFGIAIGLTLPHMPVIEGWLRPVVDAVPARPLPTRTATRTCFSYRLHKRYAAEPIVYQFRVEVRQNENWLAPDTINAHIANDDDTPAPDDYENHLAGTTWTRRWCADLPRSVAPWQVIRIGGYAVHRAHPFWNVHSPLPAFTERGL